MPTPRYHWRDRHNINMLLWMENHTSVNDEMPTLRYHWRDRHNCWKWNSFSWQLSMSNVERIEFWDENVGIGNTIYICFFSASTSNFWYQKFLKGMVKSGRTKISIEIINTNNPLIKRNGRRWRKKSDIRGRNILILHISKIVIRKDNMIKEDPKVINKYDQNHLFNVGHVKEITMPSSFLFT